MEARLLPDAEKLTDRSLSLAFTSREAAIIREDIFPQLCQAAGFTHIRNWPASHVLAESWAYSQKRFRHGKYSLVLNPASQTESGKEVQAVFMVNQKPYLRINHRPAPASYDAPDTIYNGSDITINRTFTDDTLWSIIAEFLENEGISPYIMSPQIVQLKANRHAA